LAGISIASLTGSGLFENAKLAKEKSEAAEEKQEGTLADYENIMNGYINNNRETVTVNKEEYENLKARVTALETETQELKSQLETQDISSYMTLDTEYVSTRVTSKLTKSGNTIVLTAYLDVVKQIANNQTIITIDSQYAPKDKIVEMCNVSNQVRVLSVDRDGKVFCSSTLSANTIITINATWQI